MQRAFVRNSRFPADGEKGLVSIKRKCLKVLFMLMMAVASFGSPMNHKEIEDLMRVMNETRVELSIPDPDPNGESALKKYSKSSDPPLP